MLHKFISIIAPLFIGLFIIGSIISGVEAMMILFDHGFISMLLFSLGRASVFFMFGLLIFGLIKLDNKL